MMLVNHLGQGFGLISGGCLEANICVQARKVESFDRASYILYDSTDEDNIAAELGLGCHGSVGILIQALTARHREVLLQVLQRMASGKVSKLLHCYSSPNPADMNALALFDDVGKLLATATDTPLPTVSDTNTKHQLIDVNQQQWSLVRHKPPINLWLFGGGVDAVPVAAMASMLGWRVTLVDHRPSNAKAKDFPTVEQIIRDRPEQFTSMVNGDAAIIMSHNVEMDAAWLRHIQTASTLKYIGLLGPVARKKDVLNLLDKNIRDSLADNIHGPMGFDIGGDLPASVALSVLAQCHQVLAGQQCF
jgi:xanthine dehydrogenase accessory factor